MEASLYIHIPFCAGACDYCDFYSVPLSSARSSSSLMLEAPRSEDPRLKLFLEKLLLEGKQLFETFRPDSVPTVYIGGGTPSVLGSDGIRTLLNGITKLIRQNAPFPEEITVEANSESADEAFLAAAREGGATRLSLGVQTFHDPSRRAVNRLGPELYSACSGETWLTQRLALAAKYFPHTLSVDLISGLPLQNEKVLLDDIAAALSFSPAHVSLYALTLEPGTALAERSRTEALLPAADEADRLWLCGRDALEKAGYAQYEVSNFCLASKESRHNVRYWLMRNWLALGPAASATIIDDKTGRGFRYTIPPDVDAWLKGMHDNLFPGGAAAQKTQFEELDYLTLIKETLLMGFRYIEGPDEELFQRRFRRRITDCIPETLNAWRSRGLLPANKIALKKEGLLFLDSFLAEAFAELETRAVRDTK